MREPADAPAGDRRLMVFVADDDAELRSLIATALRNDGHVVVEATDGAALLDGVNSTFHGIGADPAAVVISDVRMPGTGGLAILRALRRHAWCPPFIIMTAFGDSVVHAEAAILGARVVLDKPFDLSRLRAEVRTLDREQRAALRRP